VDSEDYLGSAPPALDPPLPLILAGRYLLGDPLGRGHSGRVHFARDRLTRRPVAVKLVRHALQARREAVALYLLRLPGVVRLLDEGTEDGWCFLVMEFVEGTAFPDHRKPSSWLELAPLAEQLLAIVERIHRARALHLDLKPQNVLVRPSGEVAVLDWGLAGGMALGAVAAQEGGTRRYIAPERLAGRAADQRADLFSVGVMLTDALRWEGPPEPTVCELLEAMVGPLEGRPVTAADARARLLPGSRLLQVSGHPNTWFVGPSRIFDVARAATDRLHALAGDDPVDQEAELEAWLGAGLVQVGSKRLTLTLADLIELESDLPVAGSPGPPGAREAFSAAEQRVLELLSVAWPMTFESTIVDIEPCKGLEALLARGVVVRLPSGRLRPRCRLEPDPRRRVLLHRRLAAYTASDMAARCFHLLHAGAPRKAQEAAIHGAESAMQAGDLHGAQRLLRLALMGSAQPTGQRSLQLLRLHALSALEARTEEALRTALHLLGRTEAPEARRIETLVHAALLISRREADRADEALASQPPFDHPVLERWRWGLRLQVASARGSVAEAEIFSQMREATQSNSLVRGHWSAWQGRLLYGQGKFAEAADLHLRAADEAETLGERMSQLLNGASAAMECGQLAKASEAARCVLSLANPRKLSWFAVRARWIDRACAYRAGSELVPDAELADEAELLAPPTYAALIALNEAAIAWRSGEAAVQLAMKAMALFEQTMDLPGWRLSAALAWRCGVDIDVEALFSAAQKEEKPDLDYQTLVLISPHCLLYQSVAQAVAAGRDRPFGRREVIAPIEAFGPTLFLRTTESGAWWS